MVVKLAVTGIEYQHAGRSLALDNLASNNLNTAAYLGFQEQFFKELGIQAVEAGSKTPGKHDGRVEVASLGQYSPPAGALLAANEVRTR